MATEKALAAKTVAVINQKGGVGKTTSTVNIGAGLSRLGARVLLIDLDPQANLTAAVGQNAGGRCIADLFQGGLTWEELLARINDNSLAVVPSSVRLASAEVDFATVPSREGLLRKHLAAVSDRFDFILIDCPPALGFLTINALVAASGVLLPVLPEFLSLQGVSGIAEVIRVIGKRFNPGLDITGILINRFDRRKSLHREVQQRLKERFDSRVFEQTVRDNVAVAEAPGYGLDIFTYRPDSVGAKDYQAVCQEFIRRCSRQ
ncbi:ParA family protein [Sporolituus thermophilus]|uniref:Sporulation initiation inhibitor protein Soj n=1 Tax=Sporolituus thermophilus DSM 23256 TaxID=1123285 RepID=A0A1G7JUU6_9FIRM|nr:ParA family protein [Sporolituus thermophilus]SDF28219.1 chromosome partitioning protein [Sporolituus thermophilus DSM 23256]